MSEKANCGEHELTPEEQDLRAQLATIQNEIEHRAIERRQFGWRAEFDERQRKLIANCCMYEGNNPGGLPGHNLMLIIAKMAHMLDCECKC